MLYSVCHMLCYVMLSYILYVMSCLVCDVIWYASQLLAGLVWTWLQLTGHGDIQVFDSLLAALVRRGILHVFETPSWQLCRKINVYRAPCRHTASLPIPPNCGLAATRFCSKGIATSSTDSLPYWRNCDFQYRLAAVIKKLRLPVQIALVIRNCNFQ